MSNPKPIVVHLDTLTNYCGYFTSETDVNNGYGCNHPDCSEKQLVKAEEHDPYAKYKYENDLRRKITLAAMRAKYGSVASIEAAMQTEEGRAYLEEVKSKLWDNEFVSKFGCKMQGKCYSFSCPIATECDLEDLQELDEYYYNQYKDEEYEPSESGANLMRVDDPELIQQLT